MSITQAADRMLPSRKIQLFVLIAALSLSLFLAVLFIPQARAHYFYPVDCCSGNDCAPVQSMALVSPEYWAITSVQGTVFFPVAKETRQSEDGQAHVCMMKNPETGTMKPLCLFLPPQT